jgi:hypothetical protein
VGSEDGWFAVVGGALALLTAAAVLFIPIKIVQLIARQRRSDDRD